MMNKVMRILAAAVVAMGVYSTGSTALAATIDAASCSQADVSTAIASAANGDIVQVPAGACSWSGLTIDKAIHLRGPGADSSDITLTGNTSITKQADGIVRISEFGFSKTGGGNASHAFTIGGSWQNAEPVVIEHNSFQVSNSSLILINVAGGVIIASNDFVGEWDDSFIQPKDSNDSESSWGSPDTLGARDTAGTSNIYVENNTFYGGTNQGIDCDDSTRCVYRYNTLTYSSFNTHGYATSPVGVRHFEVYDNTFVHDGGSEAIANQNWATWIRGGTGVIYDNQIADLAGMTWGDKAELKFTVRGAEDARPQGDCSSVSYPVPRQLGQNHDGNQYITDPIYIWGNTGSQAIGAGWEWGNPCNLVFDDFFQLGRDYIVGTPRPGYTPYTYPHPLVADGTGGATGSGGAGSGGSGSGANSGSGGSGAGAASGGGPGADDGGCGCRTASSTGGSRLPLLFVWVFGVAVWRRRRR